MAVLGDSEVEGGKYVNECALASWSAEFRAAIVPAKFAGAGDGCSSDLRHHIMILGIGMDIAETARVKGSMERFGEDFLKRILLPEEIAYCMAHKEPALYVAARFAAKEAISKAFGTGVGAQLGWCDMEIRRKETGEPFVVLHGGGKKLFEARGAKHLHITLTHTANYAAAVAILEG